VKPIASILACKGRKGKKALESLIDEKVPLFDCIAARKRDK
jgi:hypothetical protein